MKRRDFLKFLVSLPFTKIENYSYISENSDLAKIYVSIFTQQGKNVYVIPYKTSKEKKIIYLYIQKLSELNSFTLYEIHDNTRWLKCALTGIIGGGAVYLYREPSSQEKSTLMHYSWEDIIFPFLVGGLLGYTIGEKIGDRLYHDFINKLIKTAPTSNVIIYGPEKIMRKVIESKSLYKITDLEEIYNSIVEKTSFI